MKHGKKKLGIINNIKKKELKNFERMRNMVKLEIRGYDKEYDNLNKCTIEGGTWIDAGSGQGAYTIPLAVLTTKVIAVDRNESSLKRLEERAKRLRVENIKIKKGDIQDLNLYKEGDIKGVVYAFSLHYQKNINFIGELLEQKEEKKDFKIVIIEYMRTTPVPWVPEPCPPERVLQVLRTKRNYEAIEKFRNNRYYIMEIKKKSEKKVN